MLFKILQILQYILSCVLEAEGLFPAGHGADKKASVMKSLHAELRKEGMIGGDNEPAGQELLKGFDSIVDGMVQAANAAGAFRLRPRAPDASEDAGSGETSPEA